MILLKNKAFIISILLWCFITVVKIINHIPWFDEAHAWTIAEQLNLVELFDFMKIEGHTILWYVLLMPFAKLYLGYPYSMQFLNWVFCLIALIIFWKKAPFDNWVKVLVTFSYPFLTIYSAYARCYAVGIMLLFMLASFYGERLKKPVMYAILLVLCANTSAMALIGATAFGIFFAYDFIKSKPSVKSFACMGTVLGLGAIIILLQIVGVDDSALDSYKGINFINDALLHDIFLKVLVKAFIFGALSIYIFVKCFKFQLRPLAFLGFTAFIMSYMFVFRFYGHYWNHAFYFIYLIIACWIGLLEKKDTNDNGLMTIFLMIVTVTQIFVPLYIKTDMLKIIFNDDGIRLSKMILDDDNIEGKTILLANDNNAGFLLTPYGKYNVVDYCKGEKFNYDTRNYPANNEWCKLITSTEIVDNRQKIYSVTNINLERVVSLIEGEEVYMTLPVNKLFGTDDDVKFKDVEHGNSYEFKKYKCLKLMSGQDYCLYRLIKN